MMMILLIHSLKVVGAQRGSVLNLARCRVVRRLLFIAAQCGSCREFVEPCGMESQATPLSTHVLHRLWMRPLDDVHASQEV